MNSFAHLKAWIKARDTKLKRFLYAALKGIITLDVPAVKVIHLPLHTVISSLVNVTLFFVRSFYWKPVLLARVSNRPKRLNLFGNGIPYFTGPLMVSMGDDCRLSSKVTFAGRASAPVTPELVIGNNVGIGWQMGFYVGTRIVVGNNVRMGGEGTLAGYPGHPLDARARAAGEPDTDDQARDIILEDDVWLARGVIVNAGVTIGRGTIVAAGSVVTKSLPSGVLAGGAPARIIKQLCADEHAPLDSPLVHVA